MSSQSRKQLEKYLGTLDIKANRVIDVGGAQNPMKGRTKSWDVFEYHIADLIHPHEEKSPVDVYGDLNDPLQSMFERRYYDVIFCIEVFEYLYNPLQALKNLHSWVSKEGSVYISFQFLYPLHPPHGMDYLRYTKYGVLKLLDKAGFKVDEYVPRFIEGDISRQTYQTFLDKQGYRYDKSENWDTLLQTGCVIKCSKK